MPPLTRGALFTLRVCSWSRWSSGGQSSRAPGRRLADGRAGHWVKGKSVSSFLFIPVSPDLWTVDKQKARRGSGSVGARGGGGGRQLSQISPLPVLVRCHFDTNVRTWSFIAVALWQDTISQGASSSERENRPVITGCFKFTGLANGEMCLSRSPHLKKYLV